MTFRPKLYFKDTAPNKASFYNSFTERDSIIGTTQNQKMCVCTPFLLQNQNLLDFPNFHEGTFLGTRLYYYLLTYYALAYYTNHVLNSVHDVLNVSKSATRRFLYLECVA